jgi:hypothetical protein
MLRGETPRFLAVGTPRSCLGREEERLPRGREDGEFPSEGEEPRRDKGRGRRPSAPRRRSGDEEPRRGVGVEKDGCLPGPSALVTPRPIVGRRRLRPSLGNLGAAVTEPEHLEAEAVVASAQDHPGAMGGGGNMGAKRSPMGGHLAYTKTREAPNLDSGRRHSVGIRRAVGPWSVPAQFRARRSCRRATWWSSDPVMWLKSSLSDPVSPRPPGRRGGTR